MALDNINQILAEKVMGWTLENYETYQPAKTPEDYADAATNDGWAWSGRSDEAWQWKPSKDRNQLALVLEKVAEMTEQDTLIEELARQVMPADFPPDKETDGLISVWEAFELLTAPPETVCRAILKVIEKEPAQ